MLRARRRSRCIRRAQSSLSNSTSACNSRRWCALHSACSIPFHWPVALPMVVHRDARHARRHSPAPLARPVRRQQRRACVRPPPHPTRTPHTPGSTPGHGPPHDPGAPHAAASLPCGSPDPPACAPSSPASSASDAEPPASQARRSKAACCCCDCSAQRDAPTPLSARQDAPLAPEAPRSPSPDAQPALPNSRIPTPTKALAASRYRSCERSLMVPTCCQPTLMKMREAPTGSDMQRCPSSCLPPWR